MPIKVSGLGFKPFCRSPDPRCSALSDTFTERKWSKGQREFTAVQSLTCRVMTFYLFVLEPLIRPSWFPVAQTWSVTCRGETSPTLKLKKKALVVRLGGFGVKKLSSPETLSPLWNTSYSVLPSLYWYAVRLLLSSINADFLAPSWGHEAESLRINASLINTVYALLKSIFTLMPTVWHLRSKGDRRGLGRVLR